VLTPTGDLPFPPDASNIDSLMVRLAVSIDTINEDTFFDEFVVKGDKIRTLPEDPDNDGDGSPASLDCDDTNPDVNPEAVEVPYNGIDEDCDGTDLIDVDLDGFNSTVVLGERDCDDNNASFNPVALEICDGFDNNCSGFIDEININSSFNGNVKVDGGTLVVSNSVTIKGNVESKNEASISISDNSVIGNVKVKDSGSSLELLNSYIKGSVETKDLD